MGIEALLTSQVIGLDAALTGKLSTTGGTLTGALAITQGTANASVLTSTGYSLTGSNTQSLIDLDGTWNTSGTPTLIKANVTDTASNASSLLMDLQVGGSSKFKVGKTLTTVTGAASSGASTFRVNAGSGNSFTQINDNGTVVVDSDISTGTFPLTVKYNGTTVASVSYQGIVTGTSGAFGSVNLDAGFVILDTDAVNILAQRNSTSAQTFRIYNTYTSSTSFENLQLQWSSNEARIGTSVGSAGGTQRDLVLGAWDSAGNWTWRLRIGTTGAITFNNYSGVNLVGDVLWTEINGRFSWGNSGGRSSMSSSADGVIQFANSARTDFGRLQLGGTTSSFPAIKRNAAAINFRLADDSADAAITAAAATFSGNVTVSAVNLVTDTTTGTKIGTATTQKIGFYNATPVDQPDTVADPSGGDTQDAEARTAINAIIDRLQDLGLIAT